MESYIVRIYRRDKNYPDKIAGLVEIVESQEQIAFISCSQLCNILSAPGPGKRREINAGSLREGG